MGLRFLGLCYEPTRTRTPNYPQTYLEAAVIYRGAVDVLVEGEEVADGVAVIEEVRAVIGDVVEPHETRARVEVVTHPVAVVHGLRVLRRVELLRALLDLQPHPAKPKAHREEQHDDDRRLRAVRDLLAEVAVEALHAMVHAVAEHLEVAVIAVGGRGRVALLLGGGGGGVAAAIGRVRIRRHDLRAVALRLGGVGGGFVGEPVRRARDRARPDGW
mmetsp:Transcript_37906/g.118822  ORF Transcript_37906/g.118822 Transcript_37906/m.118822 type:complete len:216 (-) Transcript_37906:222-869(-)